MLKDSLKRFRLISFIEGMSYLILLFIAMPIKYLADNPYFVKIVGMGHGVLFIIFIILLADVSKRLSWNNTFSLKMFIYSLLPFGMFLIEKDIKIKK